MADSCHCSHFPIENYFLLTPIPVSMTLTLAFTIMPHSNLCYKEQAISRGKVCHNYRGTRFKAYASIKKCQNCTDNLNHRIPGHNYSDDFLESKK